MSCQHTKLWLQAVGNFAVKAADGTDRTPRGRKARGVLALLAVAPDHKRTRSQLQDKLWSTRGTEQGAGSLRQALTEIRRSFADLRDCLQTDRTHVWLDPASFKVAFTADTSNSIVVDEAELFEDLDIADPEFEDWLRDQRQQQEAHRQQPSAAAHRNVVLERLPGPICGNADPWHFVLRLHSAAARSEKARLVADILTDMVARSVGEFASVDVLDMRRGEQIVPITLHAPNSRDVSLDTEAHEDATGIACRMVLTSCSRNQMLWSSTFLTKGDALDIYDPAILRDLNQVVEEVFRYALSASPGGSDRRVAPLLCRQGISQLFELKHDSVVAADRLFERAFEASPRGIYLAWRAYLRTYLLMEFLPNNADQIAEEAVAYMRRSLELEPNNSYVASFAAQVHSIVRKSHVAAYEMAERSIQLNRANPMGWACLGISECHLGKGKLGYEHTLLARELVGATPMRFQISALSCIAATMAGAVDSAVFLGEAAHGLSPAFKPPMRFLSALYLLRDQHEESQAMVEKLKLTEPNFSYELLREKSYPASSLHRSRLLEKLPGRQI